MATIGRAARRCAKNARTILSLGLALLLAAGGGVPLLGQRDTELIVIEYVFNDIILPTASNAIRNAGQTQHSMFVRLEDRPALTCTDATLNVTFEQGVLYSDDFSDIKWSAFGEPVTDVEYGAIGTTFRSNTSGAVQWLRVNVTAFDTANCFLSVTYVGSTRPVPLFDIGGDTNIVRATYYFFNPVSANPVCSIGDYFIFYNSTDGALRICENGVISDVGGGGEGTRIDLPMTASVVPDGTASNAPALYTISKSALTGEEGFTFIARAEQFQHLQWAFPVPSNFGSSPILNLWFDASSVIGTYSLSAKVRCATPGAAQVWDGAAITWDADNTDAAITVSGGNAMELLVLPLTNNDSMAANQFCQLDLELNSFGVDFDYYYAYITYTPA